jgi:hypothetical protein
MEGKEMNTDYAFIRYDFMLIEDPYHSHAYATMEEDKSGEYVKHEDCELLEKRIAELEKETEWLFDFALGYTNAPFLTECLEALKAGK